MNTRVRSICVHHAMAALRRGYFHYDVSVSSDPERQLPHTLHTTLHVSPCMQCLHTLGWGECLVYAIHGLMNCLGTATSIWLRTSDAVFSLTAPVWDANVASWTSFRNCSLNSENSFLQSGTVKRLDHRFRSPMGAARSWRSQLTGSLQTYLLINCRLEGVREWHILASREWQNGPKRNFKTVDEKHPLPEWLYIWGGYSSTEY